MEEWWFLVAGIVIVVAFGWLRFGVWSLKQDVKRHERAIKALTSPND